jgi:hypothetical protein
MTEDVRISVGSRFTILTDNMDERRVSRKIPSANTCFGNDKTPEVPQPTCCPSLSPADFFLFPKVKIGLIERRFESEEEIKCLQQLTQTFFFQNRMWNVMKNGNVVGIVLMM